MNKLLKVLEDRKVFLESAYYTPTTPPSPATYTTYSGMDCRRISRLIGATTRSSRDIPAAIRSRCLEVHFRALTPSEIGQVARQAVERLNMQAEPGVIETVMRYAQNGRDAVNMIQLAAGLAITRLAHPHPQRHGVGDGEWAA